ncbi:hypothetical protein AAC387_Pa08g2421 [Persea americana]
MNLAMMMELAQQVGPTCPPQRNLQTSAGAGAARHSTTNKWRTERRRVSVSVGYNVPRMQVNIFDRTVSHQAAFGTRADSRTDPARLTRRDSRLSHHSLFFMKLNEISSCSSFLLSSALGSFL